MFARREYVADRSKCDHDQDADRSGGVDAGGPVDDRPDPGHPGDKRRALWLRPKASLR